MKHAHEPTPCTIEAAGIIATIPEGATPEQRASGEDMREQMAAYFANFAAPVLDEGANAELCFHCGKPLTGLASVFMGGGFVWGIAHGEGQCSACGWPARAHHFAKDRDGGELFTLRNRVLSYHPSVVSMRGEEEKAATQ